jgi:hypothetical protein
MKAESAGLDSRLSGVEASADACAHLGRHRNGCDDFARLADGKGFQQAVLAAMAFANWRLFNEAVAP